MWEEFKNNFWDLSDKFDVYDKESVFNHNESPTWIYFLYDQHKDATEGVVYIGQSVQPRKRIKQHAKDNEKEFIYFNIVPTQTNIPNIDEALYIAKYQPPYNKKLPKNPILIPLDEFTKLYPGPKGEAIKYMEKREIWDDIYGETYVNMVNFYESILYNCKTNKSTDKIKEGDK